MHLTDPKEHNALGDVFEGSTSLFKNGIVTKLHSTAIIQSLCQLTMKELLLIQRLAIVCLLRLACMASFGALDLGPITPLLHRSHYSKVSEHNAHGQCCLKFLTVKKTRSLPQRQLEQKQYFPLPHAPTCLTARPDESVIITPRRRCFKSLSTKRKTAGIKTTRTSSTRLKMDFSG